MFDAYTIKKVLPRLVIAVILIQLSWFIFTGLIAITNIVAFGLQAILAAPFGGTANLGLDSIWAEAGLNQAISFSAIVAAGVVGYIGAGGIFAIAVFLFLSLFVGYIVLLLRKIILIALLVLAPVAIVAWILPGTQRLWKMWWDNFSKLLIMFPLILLMLTAGSIFAQIASKTETTDAGKMIIILAAVFTPFFLIPKTYQLAGAGLGFAAGWITGRTQPLSDMAGKRGRAKNAERLAKAGKGDLFSERNALTRRFNKISAGIGTGGVSGAFGLNKKGRGNLERLQMAQQAEKLKEQGVVDALYDDNVRYAVQQGNAKAAKAALDRRVAAGKITQAQANDALGMAKSIGFTTSSRLAALNFEAPNKSRNFVDEVDANGNVIRTASQVMNDTIDEVADATGVDRERLRQSYMYAAGTQGGRLDLRAESVDKVLQSKFDTRLLQSSTAPAWEAITKRNIELLKTGTDDEKYRAGAQLLAMQESLPGASEEARAKFVEIMSQEVDYTDNSTPMESQLANLAGIQGQTAGEVAQVFRATSSTYSQNTPLGALGAQQQQQQQQQQNQQNQNP